ncbi:hypothetical protein [Lutibacter sp.]|uniref:hypothetical protein n=1 Tax=Lutibacter sp. TaxID=1925666 RepID=UPI00356432BB
MFIEYSYIGFYTIILIVGFYHFKKYEHSVLLKWWMGFLVYSFLTELVSRYTIERFRIRAIIIYNSWYFLNALFYLLFYFYKVNNRIRKRILLSLISVYLVFFGLQFVYLNYTKEYFVYTWMAGQLFVVFSVIIYFAEMLNSDKIINIQKSLFFWISLGVLIFNVVLLPVFVIGELIDWQGIFEYIIFGANIILSLCFITGFVLSKKEFNN